MSTNTKLPTRFRWVVAAMFFVAYMIAGADRANIGVVIPFIKKEFQISNTDVGAMASLFYITYAVVQIPTGWFYVRFGIRKLFTLCLLLTSLATLFIGLTNSVPTLKAGRAFLGAAEGPLNIGIVSIINRWFPPKEKGLATGIFMSAIKFAPAFVPPVCALIVSYWGWRDVFYIFAVPGVFSAALWFWLVKDEPAQSRYCSREEVDYIKDAPGPLNASLASAASQPSNRTLLDRLIRTRKIQLLDDNRSILLSWNNWGCALGYFLMVGITYAIMTWVPTYLINVKHYSVMNMGAVASAPWIGAIIGNLAGGWLSDRFFEKRRKPVMLITTASTIIMMYALIHSPSEPLLLAGLFLLTGILLNLGYSTFLVYPMGLATKDRVPFAASIVNTAGSLGGAFAPYVVGVILDHYNWDYVFGFLAVCSLATFLILLLMIEPMALPASQPSNDQLSPTVSAVGQPARA